MAISAFLIAFVIIIIGIIISAIINQTHIKHQFTFKSAAIILSVLAAVLAFLDLHNSGARQNLLPPQSTVPAPVDSTSQLLDSPSFTDATAPSTETLSNSGPPTSSDAPTPSPSDTTLLTSPSSPLPVLPAYFTDIAQIVEYDDGEGYEEPNQPLSILGTTYNHALREASTCQSDDGGDYWADYSVSNTWSRLTGVVGLADSSKSQSPVTWRIYLNNAVVQQGTAQPGQLSHISLSMKGKYRVRLWMNDARAPSVSCGFGYVSSLAWGDLTLTAS